MGLFGVLFFFSSPFFTAKITAQKKTSALCENSKLQITTCSTQINVNFLMLDSINIDYKNEILII